ncbi:PSR2 [Scenedesmus sp. PABB004]|nr:PSR2 [Scenedesmus sp. PABB004]
MKFGKRLAAEAARCWPEACLDYKSIKRALKNDLAAGDPAARSFLAQLVKELAKVSRFYVEKAEALEAALGELAAAAPPSAEALDGLRAQIRELIKFVALNYLGVVKAIKKRNRHARVAFGDAAAPHGLHAMDLLRSEVFFTSPRLAALSTRAELMAAGAPGAAGAPAAAASAAAAAAAAGGVEAEDYLCPICLDVLRSPVVLTASGAPAAPGGAAPPQQGGGAACCGGGAACEHGQQQQAAEQQRAADELDGAGASRSSSTSSSSGKEGLVVLEKLVAADASGSAGGSAGACDVYNCPVCRQPQVLSIDNMAVDPQLSRFVDELRLRLKRGADGPGSAGSASSRSTLSSAPPSPRCAPGSRTSSVASVATEEPEEAFLLPRQAPCHAGRLTVLLDLDGTLVSSYTPRRAPKLPSMRTHLVGVGSELNPGGVFVVERPGLGQFLAQLAQVAEVVVFTAGLEDYASPIIDAIDPAGTISGRLYRGACTRTPHHQCVKDLALVGRPLSRTVLVDDTPLAFLHQPANGVPVLGFRGDPDDRLLLEAVLPLLQNLASAPDVRSVLERRFAMCDWFTRNGYPPEVWAPRAAGAEPQQPEVAAADAVVVVDDAPALAKAGGTVLVCDFDKTLTSWDAGERLVSELAPELVPWLASLEQPANFVPITNEVLAEVARRGVGRDALLTRLRALGGELPPATGKLLGWAAARGLPVKVLSDCNAVFIRNILAGAGLGGLLQRGDVELITNAACFERLPGAGGAVGLGAAPGARGGGAPPTHKLVIAPRHAGAAHGCPRCPANLCKGREMARLVGAGYAKVVYAGDGANDICPALALGPGDVVLARAGDALARYVAAAAADPSLAQLRARVCMWSDHEQLAALAMQHAGC